MLNNNQQRGFSALFVTVLIFFAIFAIAASIFVLTYGEQKIVYNIIKSSQAYYAAESGLEDAILRVEKLMDLPPDYSVSSNGATALISVQEPDANTKIITSNASAANIFRKLKIQLNREAIRPQFFYGVQAGELGIVMENNSSIEGANGNPGNVYSNGPISGANGATITGTASLAGGASLDDIIVLGNAYADDIDDSKICGDAYYQTIDSSSLNFLNNPSGSVCPQPLTPGTANADSPDLPLQDMPISDPDIEQWKQDAMAGGIYYGDLTINENISYGPKKIDGNLILTSNNKVLTVTGTIYVTGRLDVANGSSIQCDASYNRGSCVVVVDGWIHIENNGIFNGSGQAGSYIMILSTSDCDGSFSQDCTHHNAAIDLHNGAVGAIFFANNGMIYLHNGVEVTELTAQKIYLNQGATIRYEQGLANASFPSGPGGSWEVISWEEL